MTIACFGLPDSSESCVAVVTCIDAIDPLVCTAERRSRHRS
jgi:hypothetical protein